MADVLVVPFVASHTDDLVRLWRRSFEHGVGVVDPHPIEEQRQYFIDSVLPSCTVRVALQGGELAGFVASNAESVSQLYVRVGCQRQGIGTRLLNAAKQASGGSLWLYTFAGNHGAQAFYEREGFRVLARGHEPSWGLDDIKYGWVRLASTA